MVKASMKFGANRAVFEIQRAERNEDGEPIRDEFGRIRYNKKIELHESHNITVTAALLAAKDRLFNPATSNPVADYIALSMDTHTPVVGDTTLLNEITTNGLQRALATYSVAGCGSGECILSKQFTAGATFNNVQLMGLFDAPTGGNLYFEATIALASLLVGDLLTGKWDKCTIS
jgi:hypothetical protein